MSLLLRDLDLFELGQGCQGRLDFETSVMTYRLCCQSHQTLKRSQDQPRFD